MGQFGGPYYLADCRCPVSVRLLFIEIYLLTSSGCQLGMASGRLWQAHQPHLIGQLEALVYDHLPWP